MYVIGWETCFYGLSHWRSHLKKQSRDPDIVGRVQNGTCQTSVAKFTTINQVFFVIVNKSSIPVIVPEQSESASFVTLVEIHNVDVPAASNQNATVLSPTAGTLQCRWPSAIVVDFEIESDSGSNSHT